MAKVRGKKRWRHKGDLYTKLMAIEIILDSLHQKSVSDPALAKYEKKISKALGMVRSLQLEIINREKSW